MPVLTRAYHVHLLLSEEGQVLKLPCVVIERNAAPSLELDEPETVATIRLTVEADPGVRPIMETWWAQPTPVRRRLTVPEISGDVGWLATRLTRHTDAPSGRQTWIIDAERTAPLAWRWPDWSWPVDPPDEKAPPVAGALDELRARFRKGKA